MTLVHLSQDHLYRQHMLVIHERKTRYTAAVKLQTKTASETREALIKFMKCVLKDLRKTITFDNGMKFSQHYRLKERMDYAYKRGEIGLSPVLNSF